MGVLRPLIKFWPYLAWLLREYLPASGGTSGSWSPGVGEETYVTPELDPGCPKGGDGSGCSIGKVQLIVKYIFLEDFVDLTCRCCFVLLLC